MKKLWRIVSAALTTMLLAFGASACDDDVPPGPIEGGDDSSTTINDAYADERPDYDSMFDYDSGYVPAEPPDVNKTVNVTIDSNYVKFADGSSTAEFKVGKKFTEEDFDLTEVGGGRTLEGFATVQSDGSLGASTELSAFSVPYDDVTVTPYFSPEEGFTWLNIGSGKNTYFNTDGVPGSITSNGTVSYTPNVLVRGGADGYVEMGGLVREPSAVTQGSGLRFDSKYTLSPKVYEFKLNFENFGSTELHLSVYQIAASAEYKNSSLSYESRYCVNVDLAPGESMNATAQYALSTNTNVLTYIVADEDAPRGMTFGMSLSVRETELEAPETVNPEPENVAITLDLPDGITVDDGFACTQLAGGIMTVPSAEQITNATGRTISGWYIKKTNGASFITSSTKVPENGATIAPYFAPAEGTALTLGSGNSTKGNIPDYYGLLSQIDDTYIFDALDESSFFSTAAAVDGLKGVALSNDGALSASSYFRFKTAAAITATHTYKFIYTLQNLGTETVSFRIYQLESELNITGDDGAVRSDIITLAAGAKTTVEIEKEYAGNNSNALTLFVTENKIENLQLGVAMSYADEGVVIDPDVKYTLTIASDADVTFAGGAKSVELSANETLPEIINNTGRTIAGWYGESGKISAADFTMPAGDLQIAPYFEAADGFSRLWAMSGKASGLPNNMVEIDGSFTATASGSSGYGSTMESAKTVVMGDNGLAEEGVLVNYTGSMSTSAQFRFDTSLGTAGEGGAPGSLAAGTHTYYFNFENKGEETISFNVWIVNSGTNKTSTTGKNSFSITLAPGEYITVVASPTYSGSNGNMLAYFECAQSVENGFSLGVAMSVRYNYVPVPETVTATFDLPDGITVDESYNGVMKPGERLVLPAAEQITNTTGSEIAGWYIVTADGEEPVTDATVVPDCDFTISVRLEGQEEPEPETVTINLILPEGLTVDGYNGVQEVGKVLVTPSAEQITNATGREILGWYIAYADGYSLITDSTAVPEVNTDIAPYFAPAEGTSLTLGSGNASKGYLPDYYGNLGQDDEYTDNNLTISDAVVGGLLGKRINHAATLVANDYFRFKTTATITGGNTYKFIYALQNFGTESVSFRIYQVQSGIKMTADDGAVRTDIITLPAGASATAELEIKFSGSNSNALTIFVTESEAVNLRLGVAMSYVDEGVVIDPNVKYTLTLTGDADVTFAGGAKSVELSANEALPEVTNNTGRTIAGWYSGATTYWDDAFVMPENDISIAPYFAKKTGFTDLVPGNAQGNGKPQDMSDGDCPADNFTVKDAVIGGENGIAEFGKIFTYSGTLAQGVLFRLNTVVDANAAVVTTGKEHTFRYNLENTGSTKITLVLYQVNSRSVKEDEGHVVSLEAGERMTVEFTISFANGSANQNALTLFEVSEAMEGMSLGISMSLKLAE